MGCFQYSPVEGAKSNDLDGQVPDDIKDQRWHQLMQLQQEISEDKLEEKIGQTLEVIIDDVNDIESIGRSYADAPEIDGVVRIFSQEPLQVGDIVQVSIEEATEYDLIGSVI